MLAQNVKRKLYPGRAAGTAFAGLHPCQMAPRLGARPLGFGGNAWMRGPGQAGQGSFLERWLRLRQRRLSGRLDGARRDRPFAHGHDVDVRGRQPHHRRADQVLGDLQRATYRDIGVRYVMANTHPDHDTICKFRRENVAAVHWSFVQVLLLAKEQFPNEDGGLVPGIGGYAVGAGTGPANLRPYILLAGLDLQESHFAPETFPLADPGVTADRPSPSSLTDQARRSTVAGRTSPRSRSTS